MSLAQHLSATEGIDREAPDTDHHLHAPLHASRLSKKLSYDLFPPKPADDEQIQEAVGAFEVSQTQRARMSSLLVASLPSAPQRLTHHQSKSHLVSPPVFSRLASPLAMQLSNRS